MKKLLLLLPALTFLLWMNAQNKPAYILYNTKGKKISFKKMIKTLQMKDIALFGEFHDNPICHWLELEVTKELMQYRDLVLGAEMFERDNQQALDMYLNGTINDRGLDSMARLWKNYKTDYAPLVNFAKENKIVFAATNIPRRYAALVAKGGFEALDTISAVEKSWMAPLPIDYEENYDGILWFLKSQRPDLKYATIATVSQKNIHKLLAENKKKADYIICVDEDMTTTY